MDELMRVYWHPGDRSWSVESRADVSSSWVHYDGSENQLDELLDLARDIMTGG